MLKNPAKSGIFYRVNCGFCLKICYFCSLVIKNQMKKFYLLIMVVLFGSNIAKAQLPSGSYTDYFKEGMFLIGEENYDMALKNFLEADKKDASSANINFNIGFCYLYKGVRIRRIKSSDEHIKFTINSGSTMSYLLSNI